MQLEFLQQALRDRDLSGWLFCDLHHRDFIAYRVLGLPKEQLATRRWYYLVPAAGEPQKLVHHIESGQLDALPGAKRVYSGWRELRDQLETMLAPMSTIAMQYSPNNQLPMLSLVDAGTVELVRSFGKKVASSAELVQQFILERFRQEKLVTRWPPLVAVNQNTSNPHYLPDPQRSAPIRRGDYVLLDVWGKLEQPGAVYYDVTWVGFLGERPPEKLRSLFEIVCGARDAAVASVTNAVREKRTLRGWEVDRAARGVIEQAGYGPYFPHRTGHSIGEEVHGNGANMDDLETHDEREIIPCTGFSIEPGIYLPEFGVRSEVDVFVDGAKARVTGAVQNEIVAVPVAGAAA